MFVEILLLLPLWSVSWGPARCQVWAASLSRLALGCPTCWAPGPPRSPNGCLVLPQGSQPWASHWLRGQASRASVVWKSLSGAGGGRWSIPEHLRQMIPGHRLHGQLRAVGSGQWRAAVPDDPAPPGAGHAAGGPSPGRPPRPAPWGWCPYVRSPCVLAPGRAMAAAPTSRPARVLPDPPLLPLGGVGGRPWEQA